MTDKPKFHGDVGRFLTSDDARSRTALYRRYKTGKGYAIGSFTQAEFFGINRINKLLGRKECVGIRIYYGKTEEDKDHDPDDDGTLRSRLVLVGVRADGTDIFDDSTGRKDPGDGDTLGDGHVCPRHCSDPPSSL